MKTVSISDYENGMGSIFIIRATHKGEGWRYKDEFSQRTDPDNLGIISEACFTVDTGGGDNRYIFEIAVFGKDLIMVSNSELFAIRSLIKIFLGDDMMDFYHKEFEIDSGWEEKPKVAKHFSDYLREQDAY